MERKMIYKNVLDLRKCNICPFINSCYLCRKSLHNYPESTQYILIHLNKNEFYFNNEENMWHTNYQTILDQIIAYYNAQDNMIQENSKPFLSSKAQRDSDRQLIRKKFKQFLDAAAKVTERSDPKTSIMFDGIGLVLADDYIEAVHKILSMFQKYDKMINENSATCNQFSAYNYQ